MRFRLQQLWVAEEGQDLVEYALLASFIAVVSIAGLLSLGPVIANFYSSLTPYF
jgi:Flp pilus assembly pilin Flp